MINYILDQNYEVRFNDAKYPSRITNLLRGLAAAIQDSHPTWRPTLSELKALLSQSKASNKIVLAGSAYGAAKTIKDEFPGPAILLFGAAVNAIGYAPQTELEKYIASAKAKLSNNSLRNDQDIKEVLQAAKERAKFDKVGEMLRLEFRNGLKKTGKHDEKKISEVVKEIVQTTHDVRHKGLIDRFHWDADDSQEAGYYSSEPEEVKILPSSTDISILHEKRPIKFQKSSLQYLLPYAQEGCAHAILSRMEELRR